MKGVERPQQRNRRFNRRYAEAPQRADCERLAAGFIGEHAQKLKHPGEVAKTAAAIFNRHLDVRGVRIPNPSGSAFAAHYIAGFMEGRIRTAAEFREAAGIGSITLRKCVRDVLDGLGIEHSGAQLNTLLFDPSTSRRIQRALEKWQGGGLE